MFFYVFFFLVPHQSVSLRVCMCVCVWVVYARLSILPRFRQA